MRLQTIRFVSALVGLFLAAGMTGGCASPAQSEGTRPATLKIAKTYPHSVRIKVGGGRPTKAATDASQISNEAFAQALADTITQCKLFSEVARGDAADYLLNVEILSIEQPVFGFNMTVRMEAAWELLKADPKTPVLRESITSSHTATTGDAFAGVTRCRLATEGAAKKNIEQGITKISMLAP